MGARDMGGPMGPMSRGRDPMPMPPSLGGMRGGNGMGGAGRYDSMFSRRSPPGSRGGNGMGRYEDFSRDSFDDRMMGRGGGMRGPSPPGRRYAPY